MKQEKCIKLNKILSIIAVLTMIFLFTGCAQKLPKPSENLNAILVIPAKVVNKTQIERKYDYILITRANRLPVHGTRVILIQKPNYSVKEQI